MSTYQDTNLDEAPDDILEHLETLESESEKEPWGETPEGVDPDTWKSFNATEKRKGNDFLSQFQRGLSGMNIGLGNGLTGVNKYIHGTHQARYYLIGAESGAGKTTITDYMYVLELWLSAKARGKRVCIYYCSFEISRAEKTARWVSYYLFKRYGLQLPSNFILGRIEGNLPTKHVKEILAAYSLVKQMEDDIVIMEDVVHPTHIFETLVTGHFEHFGKVERTLVPEEEAAKGKKGYVKSYIPDDPDIMTVLVLDHLALIGHEMKLDNKGLMDKMSKYCIVLRNIFNCTCVIIQQFSTDLMAWQRTMKKLPEAGLAPQRMDFGDSKVPFRDADVVLGYIKPFALSYEKYLGYQVLGDDSLGACFIAQYIMKNRYGEGGKVLPLFLNGITGCVYDLPTQPNNMLLMQEWFDNAYKVEQLCQVYFPKGDLPPVK